MSRWFSGAACLPVLVWAWGRAQRLLPSLVWGQRRGEGCEDRDGHTVLGSWDPSPGWSHLTAPAPGSQGAQGLMLWLLANGQPQKANM